MKTRHRLAAWAALWGVVWAAAPAAAQTYAQALQAARQHDPIYAQRQADVQLGLLQAKQARLAYLPSLGASYQESDFTTGVWRAAVTLSQPLFDFDRWLQMQQGAPLALRAEASAREAEQDLARRVFQSMAAVVLGRETLKSLDLQVQTLEAQTQRALRMREMGQGTVTEVSDFEVRLAAARANQLKTSSDLNSAQRAFTLLTGLKPQVADLSVDSLTPGPQLRAVEWYRDETLRSNPVLEQSRRNVELAQTNVQRSRVEYLPRVAGYLSYGKTRGYPAADDARIGLSLQVPVNAAYLLGQSRATVELRRAQDAARYAQESLLNEAERLYAVVLSVQREVGIREKVIENAKLAVEGNLRGYQGGFRSNIDVVTAIQNQADAEVALVTARLNLVASYLNLEIVRGATLQ